MKNVYTIYLTTNNKQDLYSQVTTKTEMNRIVSRLMRDKTVTLVTIDITRSAA